MFNQNWPQIYSSCMCLLRKRIVMFVCSFVLLLFEVRTLMRLADTSCFMVRTTTVSLFCCLPTVLFMCSKPPHTYMRKSDLICYTLLPSPLSSFRNLLPISHVCTEDGEKPMVLLPFMAWGNLKLFLRQCKLAEANNPQVRLGLGEALVP